MATALAASFYLLIALTDAVFAVLSADDRLLNASTAGLWTLGAVFLLWQGVLTSLRWVCFLIRFRNLHDGQAKPVSLDPGYRVRLMSLVGGIRPVPVVAQAMNVNRRDGPRRRPG